MPQRKVQHVQAAPSLADLSDVLSRGALSGQALAFVESQQKWVPRTVSMSSIVPTYVTRIGNGNSVTLSSTPLKIGFVRDFDVGDWALINNSTDLKIPRSGYCNFTARTGLSISGTPTVRMELRYNGSTTWPQTGMSYSADYTFVAYSGSLTPGNDDIISLDTGWIPVSVNSTVSLYIWTLNTVTTITAVDIFLSAVLYEM